MAQSIAAKVFSNAVQIVQLLPTLPLQLRSHLFLQVIFQGVWTHSRHFPELVVGDLQQSEHVKEQLGRKDVDSS